MTCGTFIFYLVPTCYKPFLIIPTLFQSYRSCDPSAQAQTTNLQSKHGETCATIIFYLLSHLSAVLSRLVVSHSPLFPSYLVIRLRNHSAANLQSKHRGHEHHRECWPQADKADKTACYADRRLHNVDDGISRFLPTNQSGATVTANNHNDGREPLNACLLFGTRLVAYSQFSRRRLLEMQEERLSVE